MTTTACAAHDEVPENSVMVIHPYNNGFNIWCFDDEDRKLKGEPFVGAINNMIDAVLNQKGALSEADKNGFVMTFSATPLPDYDVHLELVETATTGSTYVWKAADVEGWLCPALFKYFPVAPPEIYIHLDVARKRS